MSDYVEEKLQEHIVQLDDIELKIGIKNLVVNPESERFLSLSESELEKLTAEECAFGRYVLFQYAMSIQKKINRATALKNWAERNLSVILAKEFHSFNEFMKSEIKRQCLINNNTYAARLSLIYNEQMAIIDSYSYLSQNANNLANSFQLLFTSKQKVEKDYT